MPFRVLQASSDPHISLRCLDGPAEVLGGYAALSHVWQGAEQPFEELETLRRAGVTLDAPSVSVKVRECRTLAMAYGLPWYWVDAPCIDQRNSAELQEAITSMFRWYAGASICFAYLPDVPSSDRIRERGSAFRRSVYFTRGWTLQELIAPRRVIFVSAEWTVLGEKEDLADVLEEITRVPADVLALRRSPSDVSVACRLSWASQRSTRRVEDQAYCLMGLFDIHMRVDYGEGDKAFQRLQQRILKAHCDHTLFAWGGVRDMDPLVPPSEAQINPGPRTSLFAPSPAAFSGCTSMHSVAIEDFLITLERCGILSAGGTESLPRFMLDHHGLHCRLPVLHYGSEPFAALLACQDRCESFIALPVQPHDHRGLVYVLCGIDASEQPSLSPDMGAQRLLRLSLVDVQRLPRSRAVGARTLLSRWKENAALGVRFMAIQIATEPSRTLRRRSNPAPSESDSVPSRAEPGLNGAPGNLAAAARLMLAGCIRFLRGLS
ncbi:HET-domain-containing protein [Trametes cingulata]|nr:HET-domain-containing protein [Trametes cingulata]